MQNELHYSSRWDSFNMTDIWYFILLNTTLNIKNVQSSYRRLFCNIIFIIILYQCLCPLLLVNGKHVSPFYASVFSFIKITTSPNPAFPSLSYIAVSVVSYQILVRQGGQSGPGRWELMHISAKGPLSLLLGRNSQAQFK